jgi:two-component system CheB/CheR fusion protein
MKQQQKRSVAPMTFNFPVVGIGASAGGLEAFKEFLKAIPPSSGMAYVLVQHLAPSTKSELTEILQRVTKIPVKEIPDEIQIEPDTIYVVPSNKILTTTDGVLKLSPRDSVKTNLIIDVFFTSLAVVRDSFAVGVVLSGTGTDGTLGLKMIRDYGGITIAQDQASAAFPDMPLHAIDAGVVDFVLPPDKIPAHLLHINRSSLTGSPEKEPVVKSENPEAKLFRQILTLIHQQNGVDFIYYKQNTIRRRIARRMAMHKLASLEDYLKLLRADKLEVEALFQDLLIPVTGFFRDSAVFENLCETIFPKLFKQHAADEPIRLWIAGCSTGEEAYSIAICLHEYLGNAASGRKIQIFASDISYPAIKKARAGIYSKDEIRSVSQERLEKYFSKYLDSYVVHKTIRDSCVFAVHNFLKDPPFAKMDFISCRNVFIYLDTFLQKKALTMFHYALNDHGLLMLGKSETVGAAPELFAQQRSSDKIYSRKPVPGRFMHVATESREELLTAQNKAEFKSETAQPDFRKSAEAIMLSKSPASVIVNEHMDIVHIHGDITPFLTPPPGKPTFNLFKMAREGLSFELRNMIHKSKASSGAVTGDIRLKLGEKNRAITIEVIVLTNTLEPYYLIFFTETPGLNVWEEEGDGSAKPIKPGHQSREFEKELDLLRKDMRALTESHDSSSEELQSANEELQSSNEELQTLNEELETSKEELQSANEELTISNQELLEKQELLHAARNYAEAIISTTREPLMVLDRRLRVKSVNESYHRKFKVTEEEIQGKYFFEIQDHLWNNLRLREWVEELLPNKKSSNAFEITLEVGGLTRNFILNAQEIVTEKHGDKLILLAIEDVTHSLINKRLQQSESRFRQLAEQIPHLVFTALPDGMCSYVNQAMLAYTGREVEEFQQGGWLSILHPGDMDRTSRKWKKSLRDGKEFVSENRIEKSDGTFHWHLSRAVPQKDSHGRIVLWVGTHTNINDQKDFAEKLEEKVRERTLELEKTNHQLNQFAYTASHDLQEPLRKIITFAKRLEHHRNNGLSEETKMLLGKIENASLRMSVLIRDLLNFSRIANAKELFQQTDLNLTLKNILNDFELLIEEKGAQISYDILPVIEAIPLQMNQLFYNLLGNALKFSKQHEVPVVRISSRTLNAKEVQKFPNLNTELNYVELIFRDNGIGFDQQYAHQIFIIFQRLNQPAQYSGTGIGLALSKKIVEIHQGEIYAQSRENVGAEFHVILPLSQK